MSLIESTLNRSYPAVVLMVCAAAAAQTPVGLAAPFAPPRSGFERFDHRWGAISSTLFRAVWRFERLDADGLPEAMLPGGSPLGEWRWNIGLGEYGPPRALMGPSWPSTCPYRTSVPGAVAFDANGDGNVDWFTCFTTDATCTDLHAFLYQGDSLGNATLSPGAIPSLPAGTVGGVAGDFDGDGDRDLIVGGVGTYNALQAADEFLENDGRGRFVHRSNRVPRILEFSRQLLAADIDGDGDLDLVKLTWTGFSNQSHVLLNDGTGTFARSQSFPNATATPDYRSGDLDGDGCADLLSGEGSGAARPVRLYMGTRQGLLVDNTWRLPYGLNTFHGAPHIADLDDDGDLDIVVPELLTRTGPYRVVRYWQNDGAANFTDVSDSHMPVLGDEIPVPPTNYYNVVEAVPADQDGDGDLDLFLRPGFGLGPGTGGCTLWNLTRHLETSGNPTVGQSSYRVSAFADPGHLVVPFASLGRTIVDLPGLGTLQIDPATALAGPALRIDRSRVAYLPMPIPNLPSLAGTSIFWQGVDIDLSTGRLHLTNAVRDTIQ